MQNKCILLILITILYFILKKSKNIENFSYKPSNWYQLKFTDKLKIYGKNLPKEYSLYADKYLVKDYIKSLNIKELHIPKTIKTLDINNKELNLDSLPEKCIIKTNNGSGDIIIIKNNRIIKMAGRGGKYKGEVNEYNKWKEKSSKPHITKTEKHYINIKPVILVEEYLGDNIKDYKFFCLNGKVKFFSIDNNRNNKKKHCRNFYDINFNLLKFTKGQKICEYKNKIPINFHKMIKISEIISKKFEFCRVDLYEIKKKIYFGEITFVPAAGTSNIKHVNYDYEIGRLWE
jgi:hypothetical protein